MKDYQWLFAALLAMVVLPANAQSVSKSDVLGAVTMSVSLAECGYDDASLKIGNAALKGLPLVGLDDKSDEVIQAMAKGKQAVKSGAVKCADVADYARAAGIM